jgi:hypothetical protein
MSAAETQNELGWIEGKDKRLEVLSEVPYVVATPVEVLADERITDKRLIHHSPTAYPSADDEPAGIRGQP